MTAALEKHLFTHLRELLGRARDEYARRYPGESWPGPDPDRIGLHMLGGATLLTDSCNAARAARAQLAKMIADAVEKTYDPAAWALLSAAEKHKRTHVYSMDCHQHLRNIFLNAGSAAGAAHLKESLRESLAQFSSFERMSTDASAIVRAVYKELHPEGDYAKGHGKEAETWRKDVFGSTPWLRLERAGGGRQASQQ